LNNLRAAGISRGNRGSKKFEILQICKVQYKPISALGIHASIQVCNIIFYYIGEGYVELHCLNLPIDYNVESRKMGNTPISRNIFDERSVGHVNDKR
jgi:hypothetical protein